MAKKSYVVQDDSGHDWLVRQGDPAFELVSRLRHPVPVLPSYVLRTGDVLGHGIDVAARVSRLSKACERLPEDGELAAALTRAIAMAACLKQLTPASTI